MSKHSRRRERREQYHRMLDAELPLERAFIGRVIGSLNREGIDIAHDGRPIRSDFWRYIRSRGEKAPQDARAGFALVERAVDSLRVRTT